MTNLNDYLVETLGFLAGGERQREHIREVFEGKGLGRLMN